GMPDVRGEADGGGDDAEDEEDRGGLFHVVSRDAGDPADGSAGRGGVDRLDGGATARRRRGRPEDAGGGREAEGEAAVATGVDRGAADEAALRAADVELVAADGPGGAGLVDHPLGERVRLPDREHRL